MENRRYSARADMPTDADGVYYNSEELNDIEQAIANGDLEGVEQAIANGVRSHRAIEMAFSNRNTRCRNAIISVLVNDEKENPTWYAEDQHGFYSTNLIETITNLEWEMYQTLVDISTVKRGWNVKTDGVDYLSLRSELRAVMVELVERSAKSRRLILAEREEKAYNTKREAEHELRMGEGI